MRHSGIWRNPSIFVLLAGLLLGGSAYAADTYTLDADHSTITFRVRHLISKVSGSFGAFEAEIVGDQGSPEKGSVQFTIDVASIDTGNEKRDEHLRNEDFFDAEKYPAITFKSTKIVRRAENAFDVHGTFTMRGVTRDIVVPVVFNGVMDDPWGNTKAGFEISMTLNRKDYGVSWNKLMDKGGMILGDEVEIFISLQAVQVKEEKK